MPFSDDEVVYIREQYLTGRSPADIARELNTYPSAVRRTLQRLHVPMRDLSEAAIASGRQPNPTKGRPRTEEEKALISYRTSLAMSLASDEDKEVTSLARQARYRRMSEEAKRRLLAAATAGFQRAAREGSKLKLFLVQRLPQLGYRIEDHSDGLLLPDYKVVLVIDGPHHFAPIWGDEHYARTQAADAARAERLKSQSTALIRVANVYKKTSRAKHERVLTTLSKMLSLTLDINATYEIEVL